MNYLLRALLILGVLASSLFSFGQTNEGTEFWFGFMEHHDERINNKVAMITSKYNTSGTVTVPGLNFSQTFTVAAGQVEIVTLPIETETFGSHVITNNGVKVETSNPSSVYIHQYYANHAEATLVLPVSTIGTEYYTLSYSGYFTKNRHWPSQFLIVASEDETNITGRLSSNSENGGDAGSTFNVTLNAGETYQVLGRNPNDDLSGSYITADKNFSVFCGSKYTALSCLRGGRDNLLEQALPLDTWGDRFVSAPFQEAYDDIFRILAAEDNTQVEVLNNDGTRQNYTLNAGQIEEYNSNKYAYITTSKPALIAQYINQLDCGNGETGDPSMIYLNSVLQIKDTVTLYNSPFELIVDNFINVIGRTSDQDNIMFDGRLIADQAFTSATVGENDEYISFTLQTNAGSHTITSSGCGVIAKAYGLGTYESYAYSGGASFNKINASPIPDGGCLNDTVFFASGLPEDRFSVKWTFAPGDTVFDHTFERIYDQLGSLPVHLSIYDECFDILEEEDKVMNISLRQSVDASPLDRSCEGNSILLSATDVNGATYEWTGPNEYFSDEKEPTITDLTVDMSGPYQVIGIVSGCATFPAEVNLLVDPNPTPDLGTDLVICPKSAITTVLYPGSYSEYLWSDGSTDTSFVVQSANDVTIQVMDINGCIGMDTISLTQQCPTAIYIPNVFSPESGDVDNELFGVDGEDIIRFELSVYDRWGNKLFSTSDQNIKWDGRSRDKKVEQGNYSWILDLEGYEEDGSTFRKTMEGSLLLVR